MTAETVAKTLLDQRIALTGFVRAAVADAHSADDIFQETCVKAIARAEQFETKRDVLTWSRTVARNQAIDLLRKRNRKHGEQILPEEVIDLLAAEDADLPKESNRDRLQALEGCLESLTPKTREILAMRYTQGLPGHEVAARLTRKPATVYKTLARAYVALRSCVNRALKSEATS
jgi:RNA polymerase sigma-70 factor (ECF subfamily)